MRKVASRLLGALVLLSVIIPAPVRSSVILSELCDPRLNYATDRFIEIYNAGADPVDLTGWSLVAIANSVEAHTWALSGSIAPGQALVAGNSTTVTVFPVAFPSATWSGGNVNWNGKVGDGAKLLNGSGTVTDRMMVLLLVIGAMCFGMVSYGKKVVNNVSRNITFIDPLTAFTAQFSAGMVLTFGTLTRPGLGISWFRRLLGDEAVSSLALPHDMTEEEMGRFKTAFPEALISQAPAR